MNPSPPSSARVIPPAPHPVGLQNGALPAGTGVRRAETLADLCAVFEPQVQVCVHPRQGRADLAAALRALGFAGWPGLRTSLRLGRDGPSGLSTLGLPPVAERSALLDELGFLIELYGDLLGCPVVGLRIERLERAMCPRWHVDRTGIRLLCTWLGPGTEWLDDPALDPGSLSEGAAHREPTGRAEPFDIVLLKGSAWQGNGGGGAIHRSPAVAPEAGPRVLVALDALWHG